MGIIKHGHKFRGKATRTYYAWQSAIERCRNKKSAEFHNYGLRGIAVCESWHTFANFLADMGECPPGRSLDRIDNNSGYRPGNCRWATASEQTNNRRVTIFLTYSGTTMPVTCWAKKLGIKRCTILYRLKVGWSTELALTAPVRNWGRHVTNATRGATHDR